MHRHRAGWQKQQNKSFSSGRHSSKGSLKKQAKGKIETKTGNIKTITKESSKFDRKNFSKQNRAKKREEEREARRFSPSMVVAVISLTESADTKKCIQEIINYIPDSDFELKAHSNNMTNLQPKSSKGKQIAIFDVQREAESILDILKVCDFVCFVLAVNEPLDTIGEQICALVRAQGLPSSISVLQGLSSLALKKKAASKKDTEKLLEFEFSNQPRLIPVDNTKDVSQIFRFLQEIPIKQISFSQNRPHLLVDKIEKDDQSSNLICSGYLKAKPLSVNQLIHIPGYGDFQIEKIDIENGSGTLLPDDSQEPLQALNEEDSTLNNEMTWPDEMELATAEKLAKRSKKSNQDFDYFKDDYNPYDDMISSDSEDEDDDEEMSMDPEIEDQEEDMEDSGSEDEEMEIEERKRRLDEDQTFPDEIDTPDSQPASVRFARFRGLKSFRTSKWDPKELLPEAYSRISQFQNFNRSKHRALKEFQSNSVVNGQYISITIKNSMNINFEKNFDEKPLIIGGLLKYENKISVLHFSIKKNSEFKDPVISKEKNLIFNYGWRRFSGSPIFSENNPNIDKHKYERFLHDDRVSTATIYAPICFLPSSVLIFKDSISFENLLATGGLMSVDPDRIILKKIILSGFPLKISNRLAVIREMFFFPEDIPWFKPLELFTKWGRRGNIKESLGTHGRFKAVFDGVLNPQDTVCLSLFKRIFPPFSFSEESETIK